MAGSWGPWGWMEWTAAVLAVALLTGAIWALIDSFRGVSDGR